MGEKATRLQENSLPIETVIPGSPKDIEDNLAFKKWLATKQLALAILITIYATYMIIAVAESIVDKSISDKFNQLLAFSLGVAGTVVAFFFGPKEK